jgi:hypothetical protein
MHNITLHFTVRPLLPLSAQIRRYPMVSYAYKAQWSLQNTPPVDWWGISNIRLYTVQITLPATTKRPHSSPEPPPTTALPQNVPMSPLMRLVALRVAAAALDGGRPWWMRQRTFTMLPLFSACVWMRKKCSRVAEPVHSLLQGSIVNREFNPQKSSLFSYLTLFCVYGESTLITCQHLLFLPIPWPLWRTADFRACGVATPSPLGAASSTHHGRCHLRLVWKKNRGKSGCVIYKVNGWWWWWWRWWYTWQSNRCGGGTTKTMDCYYYYYYRSRGD